MENGTPRDSNGRFAPGGPGGPGRPRNKGCELQRAAQDAIAPEHMRALLRKALAMALGGNLAAMRFVAEQTIGRARQAAPDDTPLQFSMPRLETIRDCEVALDRVAAALIARTISLEEARAFTDLINARVKAIEVRDLEARIAELEKAAENVDLQGNGRRRTG